MVVSTQVNTHQQEIDLKLMKYRLNSLKETKGKAYIYLDKDKYGHCTPIVGGDKYILSNVKQTSTIDAKVMKITFEMEFINE